MYKWFFVYHYYEIYSKVHYLKKCLVNHLCSEKCSAGYEYKRGDVNGVGTLEHGVNASLEECGERCLQNSECQSYEHDAGKRQCNLNKELEPNAGRHGNFVFCKHSGNHVWNE